MRILIVSDTHGNDTGIVLALHALQPVDLVVHCGDGEADLNLLESIDTTATVRVAGNCDLGSRAPRELLCIWKGVKVLICHGDRYGVKAGLARLEARGCEAGAQAILYGHTHLAMVEERSGMLLVNPGTLTKQAVFKSCALLEIEGAGLKATIHPLPSQLCAPSCPL